MITTDYNPDMYLIDQPFAALVSFYTPSLIREQNKLNENYYKLQELKKDIGEDLYNSLGNEDRDFILKTEGSVDFGYKVDLIEMEKILASDDLID